MKAGATADEAGKRRVAGRTGPGRCRANARPPRAWRACAAAAAAAPRPGVAQAESVLRRGAGRPAAHARAAGPGLRQPGPAGRGAAQRKAVARAQLASRAGPTLGERRPGHRHRAGPGPGGAGRSRPRPPRRARLAQTTLTAPADARRADTRQVEPGQIVQPGRALLQLALAGPRQLLAPVDERYLQQLQVGQLAGVRADAFPDQRFTARVLSASARWSTRSAARSRSSSRCPRPPAPTFLREDMTLSVEVETARRDRALVVPLAALRSDDGAGRRHRLAGPRRPRRSQAPLRLGLRTHRRGRGARKACRRRHGAAGHGAGPGQPGAQPTRRPGCRCRYTLGNGRQPGGKGVPAPDRR